MRGRGLAQGAAGHGHLEAHSEQVGRWEQSRLLASGPVWLWLSSGGPAAGGGACSEEAAGPAGGSGLERRQ